MPTPIKLALAQSNFCVGDIAANSAKIVAIAARARDEYCADVVVFPELALTGYPPEDLLFRPGFHRRVRAALHTVAVASKDIDIIIGYPEETATGLYNSCAVYRAGVQLVNYRKQMLPNYAVFDEKRYFVPGDCATVFELRGVRFALSICEDIWSPATAQQAAAAGAQIICNINASPYHLDKPRERQSALRSAACASGLPIIYLNTVGGQDELVFDGASCAVDGAGEPCMQAPAFEESLLMIEATPTANGISLSGTCAVLPQGEEAIYQALVLGIRDYIDKNGFQGCVLGLSGGIDSALTLVLAVDALGAERVMAISMPSRYTAGMSVDDAVAQCETLGCEFQVLPIEKPVVAFAETLAEILANRKMGVTAENIQARCRGVLLMAISNASGRLVLTTGNKSEMAVGYATLYGDMAGGFAPLKDIPKTLVYRLANWRNRMAPAIPARVIERPPTAELAPDQKDSDSLPPYDVLDPILERYIEGDQTPREITALGFDLATVNRIAALVDRNEYKRRQAAPGVRISKRAFGRDRRFPITSHYDEQNLDEP